MKEYFKKIFDFKDDKEENQKIKMIVFFGFYFIFFVILICLIIFGGDRHYLTQEYEKGKPSLSGSELGDSFSYTYHIVVDDSIYDYVGKKQGNYERFQFQEKEYFFDGEKYYMGGEVWIECENPYLYTSFLDIQTFVSIIQRATYVAKTEYENGDEIYHYLISSNELNDLLFQEKTAYENSSNTIDIVIDANRHITKITYGLDDYGIHREIASKKLEIELQFSEYGEIEKIENPIQ